MNDRPDRRRVPGHAPSQGLVAVLQLCDSGFPAGLFTQSSGLETAWGEGRLRDADALWRWTEDLLRWSVASLDGCALAAAWRAARRGDVSALLEADARLEAMRLAREPREASARSGRRVLELAARLAGDATAREAAPAIGVLRAFAALARQGRSPAHYATVLGVVGSAWQAPLRPLLAGALFAAASGTVAAAVRLGAADHVAAQRILGRLRPQISALAQGVASPGDDEGWTVFAPAAEIAAMRHEAGRMRMFAS